MLRTGKESGWESAGWELDVDFLFLAVKLMICSVLRNGGENGWESSGWELDVDFLFLAVKLMVCSVLRNGGENGWSPLAGSRMWIFSFWQLS